jgi:hypothetical protein
MFGKIKKLIFKKANIPIFLILILAAFMRLYHISEYLTFLGDEGRDVLVVKHILDGNLTLLGPTASVGGFFLGPIYYYFMAPFLWLFGYNPVGPAVMVALVGTLTVWLVYKVSKELFGYFPAIIEKTQTPQIKISSDYGYVKADMIKTFLITSILLGSSIIFSILIQNHVISLSVLGY